MKQVKIFECKQLREAEEFSRQGHIAIHLHRIVFDTSPSCFIRDVDAGLPIAHVFCLDTEELHRIARQYGIRVIFIDKEGTVRQHIDMCGRPLRTLLRTQGVDIKKYRE